ncbi:unnamed protein product [Calicophoron daubneyi]|uniref:Uncharacterized protein n=1 Tax=Calicophoron daubneyi TaxID=300641 RepID=A0AAV2THJ6_CALDB
MLKGSSTRLRRLVGEKDREEALDYLNECSELFDEVEVMLVDCASSLGGKRPSKNSRLSSQSVRRLGSQKSDPPLPLPEIPKPLSISQLDSVVTSLQENVSVCRSVEHKDLRQQTTPDANGSHDEKDSIKSLRLSDSCPTVSDRKSSGRRLSVNFAPMAVLVEHHLNRQPTVSYAPIVDKSQNIPVYSVDHREDERIITRSRFRSPLPSQRRYSLRDNTRSDSENLSPPQLLPSLLAETDSAVLDSPVLSLQSVYPTDSDSSVSSLPSPLPKRPELSWREPTEARFIPFKKEVPPSTSFLQSGGTLRRSRRIRAPHLRDPFAQVVYEWDQDSTGYPYRKPVGVMVHPKPEEIRRRRNHLKRIRSVSNQPDSLKRAKDQRTARLQKLAARFRRNPSCERQTPAPKIYLDDDVKWAPKDMLQLPVDSSVGIPNQQVIFPGPSAPPIKDAHCVQPCIHTVPAMSGLWPTKSHGRPLPRFEVSADLTTVVSKEQKRRQLHYDPDCINVFGLTQHPPCPRDRSGSEESSPWAVQIATLAYRLVKPCYVVIPRGIPYKFMNATDEPLILQRFKVS